MANVKLHFLNRVNDELTRSLNLTADSRNALLIQKGLLKMHCHVKKKNIYIYLSLEGKHANWARKKLTPKLCSNIAELPCRIFSTWQLSSQSLLITVIQKNRLDLFVCALLPENKHHFEKRSKKA